MGGDAKHQKKAEIIHISSDFMHHDDSLQVISSEVALFKVQLSGIHLKTLLIESKKSLGELSSHNIVRSWLLSAQKARKSGFERLIRFHFCSDDLFSKPF
jgi:hypothetical protein